MSNVPSPPALPSKSARRLLSGPLTTSFTLHLRVVTPIFGGSERARRLNDKDPIRVPSIRGQLRFWWRALHAHAFKSSKELYEAEARLWGAAAGSGARSNVAVIVRDVQLTVREIEAVPPNGPQGYALWPANAPPTAPRYASGVSFVLTIDCPAGADATAVERTVKAWVLFGGYGGRTRRGVGSLTVTKDPGLWLPGAPTRDAIDKLFGTDIFRPADAHPTGQCPVLADSWLCASTNQTDALTAWSVALRDWLRSFRQGEPHARGKGNGHPGRSNWPEPDKIRWAYSDLQTRTHQNGQPWAHSLRQAYGPEPAYPRAGFGLPIVGKFRQPPAGQGVEPPPFQITWNADPNCAPSHDKNRLASPLIVKPMALANGKFVPIALWLDRAWPNGKVLIKGKPRSAADFDTLLGQNDTPLFAPLANPGGLRAAFMEWISARGATEIV